MTDDEIIAALRSMVLVKSPFTDSELSDAILNQAISDSFVLLNKYKPNVVKLRYASTDPTYQLIVAYSDIYDSGSIIPYVEEYEADVGTLWVYSVPWTLQSINAQTLNSSQVPSQSFPVAWKHFQDAVEIYSTLYMANKRRVASMGSLPFDLKGDQFYSEAKDRLDQLTELLVNTMTTTY